MLYGKHFFEVSRSELRITRVKSGEVPVLLKQRARMDAESLEFLDDCTTMQRRMKTEWGAEAPESTTGAEKSESLVCKAAHEKTVER